MIPTWWSASQISTYIECPRKWAFRSIEHLDTPQNPSAALGEKIHGLLEKYFAKKIPIDFTENAGYIAHAALEFLPPPPVPAEEEILLITPRHYFYGKVDLVDETTHTIYDHKSTSNFAYAKSETDLVTDIQATIYAVWGMVEWQRQDVNLQWTYTRTRGALKAMPVRATAVWSDARVVLSVIEDVADEMQAIKDAGKRALDLAPNPKACHAYGRCPYQFKCNLGPKDLLRSMNTMTVATTEDFLDRLTKKVALVSPGQINPPEGTDSPIPTPESRDSDGSKVAGPGDSAPHDNGPVAPAKKASKRLVRTEPQPPMPAETAPAQKGLINLFIDCQPSDSNEPLYTFADVLKQATEVIRVTEFRGQKGPYKITDYRQAEYGTGPAILLDAVKQIIDGFPVFSLAIDTITPEAQIVLNELIARAVYRVRPTH